MEDSRTKNAFFYLPSVVGTHVLINLLGANGHGFITQVMPDFNDVKIPLIAQYQADMRQAGFEGQINYLSLEGYMSALLFCQVMNKMEGEPTREKFIATLETTGMFDLGGIPLHYSSQNHNGIPGVFLTEFKDGKLNYLGQ
jgi:ABC-type branched-subunit amino acid transport system substrate-binding protein